MSATDGSVSLRDHCIIKKQKTGSGTVVSDGTASTITESRTSGTVDKHDWETVMKKKIAEWVRATGFGYVKFLPRSEPYDCTSRFFISCMDKCYAGYKQANKAEQKILFQKYGKMARDKLSNRRHNVIKSMKDRYKGK